MFFLLLVDTLIPVPNKFTGKKLESASSMDQIFIENRFAFYR